MSMVGKTIAHYSITEEIGRGGMGEVYLATDTKLKRQVAIKILSEALAGDGQHMARLTHEAEVLASLDHPGIGQIYGIEDTESGKALVLQLIEGPTLADRIKQGPMSVEEALPIALEIAEALEAAHEKGIIHRDLKPANIKITPEGKVKILDFGLAKAVVEEEKSAEELANSPTLTMQATQAGVILGTAGYMSPEQARGRAVDKRTDIWAFGAVLYEMLSGRQAFPGHGWSEILARVIEREPNWEALPNHLPRGLEIFLRRCLTKEPNRRLQAIGDMRLAIEGAFETGVERTMPWRRVVLPWLIAASAIIVAVGAIVSERWSGTDARTRHRRHGASQLASRRHGRAVRHQPFRVRRHRRFFASDPGTDRCDRPRNRPLLFADWSHPVCPRGTHPVRRPFRSGAP